MFETYSINPPLKSKPRTQPVEGLVIHWTAGNSRSGAVKALREKGLSYHYIIDRDGKVFKAVAVGRTAFHAGNSYGPEHAKLGIPKTRKHGEFTARTSVNGSTVGISLVGGASGVADFTDAQVSSLEELVDWLAWVVPTIYWIAGHKDVSPGRKIDPGGYNVGELAQRRHLKFWQVV